MNGLGKEILKILNEDYDDNNIKNLALLRYLYGLITLNTSYKITNYNEEELLFNIGTTFDGYIIEVRNDGAYLISCPDYEHDNIYEEAKLDLLVSELDDDINSILNKAIEKTEEKLVSQLKELAKEIGFEELSLMARDILNAHK